MFPDSIYLDFNATSPLSQSVTDWLKSGDLLFGNPSSQHSLGKASRRAINETRSLLYSTFNLSEKTESLFFQSGATEAMATFAHSFSQWTLKDKKDLLICYSRTDHPAVTTLAEQNLGSHVQFHEIKINQDLSPDHLENFKYLHSQKQKNPSLVILYHHLWVHNETGLVSPLEDLLLLKSISDLYLHVDAVQAIGKIPEWNKLTVGDIWTFSGHKFGALKGIGYSFFKKDISFTALLSGGGQQQGLRGGTENPLAIKTLALALNDLKKNNLEQITQSRNALEILLKNELKGIGDVVTIPGRRASNTIYFYFNGLTSDVALALFDLGGICISAGSACSSGASRPSVVLTQMNLVSVAKNGLRISLPFALSDETFGAIQIKIQKIFQQLRERS